MKEPVEQALSRAVEQLPQPSLQTILQTPVIRMTEHDEFTRPPRARVSPFLRLAGCAAALLFTFLGGRYFESYAVASVVDLDVNPGFEITANRRDRVLKVEAMGEDGWKYLPDINFHDMPIEDAVEQLVTGLTRNGYLIDPESVVLLSVDGKSDDRTTRLEDNLTARIALALNTNQGQGAIVRQSLKSGKQLHQEAAEYGISEGRMQLINQIAQNDPSLSKQALCAMRVSELTALSEQQGRPLQSVAVKHSPQPTPAIPISPEDDDRDDDADDDSDDNDSDDDSSNDATPIIAPDDDDDDNDDDLDGDDPSDSDDDDDDRDDPNDAPDDDPIDDDDSDDDTANHSDDSDDGHDNDDSDTDGGGNDSNDSDDDDGGNDNDDSDDD